MSRRILIIPDKFKGSLAATEAAEAIASGWAAAWPEDSIDRIPMSDGGDGFGEVMALLGLPNVFFGAPISGVFGNSLLAGLE